MRPRGLRVAVSMLHRRRRATAAAPARGLRRKAGKAARVAGRRSAGGSAQSGPAVHGGLTCFAVTGIYGSRAALTCFRWYPSPPGVMRRLSADPVKDSASWNHESLGYEPRLRSPANIGVGPVALRICRLDPSASFGLYKGPRVELNLYLCRTPWW